MRSVTTLLTLTLLFFVTGCGSRTPSQQETRIVQSVYETLPRECVIDQTQYIGGSAAFPDKQIQLNIICESENEPAHA